MFGSKAASKPQTKIDSLIGAGTRVEGSITFTGGLRVDGQIKGDVIGAAGDGSTLVVSEQAIVEGEVRVAHIVVNGTIKGPIYAFNSIELQPSSRIEGDVHYNNLAMHQGAIIDGRLVHNVDTSEMRSPVELKVAANS